MRLVWNNKLMSFFLSLLSVFFGFLPILFVIHQIWVVSFFPVHSLFTLRAFMAHPDLLSKSIRKILYFSGQGKTLQKQIGNRADNFVVYRMKNENRRFVYLSGVLWWSAINFHRLIQSLFRRKLNDENLSIADGLKMSWNLFVSFHRIDFNFHDEDDSLSTENIEETPPSHCTWWKVKVNSCSFREVWKLHTTFTSVPSVILNPVNYWQSWNFIEIFHTSVRCSSTMC